MAYAMNKSYQAMMEGAKPADQQDEGPEAHAEEGKRSHPHIFIHSHSKGHTVHVHHHDGTHEKHEHSHGDADGIAAHIHEHLGEGMAPEGHESSEAEEMAAGER